MKRLASLFFVLALWSPFYAEANLSAQLKLIHKGKRLVLGEITEAQLLVWPVDELKNYDLKNLEGQYISESFYVVKVNQTQISDNNHEVMMASLIIVFAKMPMLQGSPEWVLNGKKVNLELFGFDLINDDIQEKKEFNILEQDLDKLLNNLKEILMWLLLITILALTFYYFYSKRRKRKKVLIQYTKGKIIDRLKKMNGRKDAEAIYLERQDIAQALTLPKREWREFLDVINKHQYRPSVSDEAWSSICASRDKLLKSWETVDGV